MNISIICITIIASIYIICYYINEFTSKTKECKSLINSMYNDIKEIKNIIDIISNINIYNDDIKCNIKIIKYIISKHVEEPETADTNAK